MPPAAIVALQTAAGNAAVNQVLAKTVTSDVSDSAGRQLHRPEADREQESQYRQRELGELASEITLSRSVEQPLSDSDLVTASDRDIQSHSTYFDNGIKEVIYHGEEHFAEIIYVDGDSIVVETAGVRSQPLVADQYRGGSAFFGSAPEDLIQPEVPSDYYLEKTGRVAPVEINVENAPVFVSCLREARVIFDQGTKAIAKAGIEVYSNPEMIDLVTTPALSQLLTVSATGKLSARAPARFQRVAGRASAGGTAPEAGRITVQQSGEWASDDEWRAALQLSRQGYDLLFRNPALAGTVREGAKAGGRRISDLLIVRDGMGVPLDIYSAEVGNVARIVTQVSKKFDQVRGGVVVVQLRNSGLKVEDFGQGFGRAYKAASKRTDIDDNMTFLEVLHAEQAVNSRLPFISEVIFIP